MEPNDEGIFELQSCSEDETNSLYGLFHWKIEAFEVFPSTRNFLEAITLGEEQSMKTCKWRHDAIITKKWGQGEKQKFIEGNENKKKKMRMMKKF